ncbi:MAG TPA: fumarylacetoacetase, partial [Gemmatimonadaceae bacterium]|nr:fumarylacetoacetase [Gemmatimonadaceae bacterium]
MNSWVDSANLPDSDFPLENLPYGVFSARDRHSRIGVAIGDSILDVERAAALALFPGGSEVEVFSRHNLTGLMQLPAAERASFRAALTELLRQGSEAESRGRSRREEILIPIAEARLELPVPIGDYTDFYASIEHATNVGKMFRPDNPLLPNYKYVPIGYHGRASSIVVSGTPITRPSGQTRAPNSDTPSFGPSKMLDYESELGLYIGRGNELGSVISLSDAEDHIFGYCLVNDWSARDIQTWEYQPLGPFLAKNFATTVSPWVVPAEAVDPFRVASRARAADDPAPLDYLSSPRNEERGGIDAHLVVSIRSERMRKEKMEPMQLTKAPFRSMYWTMPQLVTHHASNGCNLKTGDLIASGTVSGPSAEEMGCLLELTRRGADPVT